MRPSVLYTIAFAAGVCVVCAILVSGSAVSLSDLQESNAALDKQMNVLIAAGIIEQDERPSREEVNQRFETVQQKVIELRSGEPVEEIDPLTYDQKKAATDPERSHEVPPNPAQIKRVADHAVVYEMRGGSGEVEMLVLPVEGKGLWSTLYGFLALDKDTTTIRGLTFYQHGETPGLGGEVDNPRWKARWPGRKAFDGNGSAVIKVIKGPAGPPEEDPHEVDGLSGATITSRGVTALLQFWLGKEGFGPYLERFRAGQRAGEDQIEEPQLAVN